MDKIKLIIPKISLYAIAVAVLFLPLKTSLSNFGLILFIVASLVNVFINGCRWYILKELNFYLLTTIALFLPVLIGLLYTPNIKEGVELTGRLVLYGIIPFCLLQKNIDSKKMFSVIFYALLIGCVLSMLYLHAINFYHYFFTNSDYTLKKLFGYNYTGLSFVASLKDMHPVYLGAYYLTFLSMLGSNKIELKLLYKIIIALLISSTVLILNSRVIIFLLILIIVKLTFKWFQENKKYLWVVLGGMVIIFFLVKNTYVYTKMFKGTIWELTDNVETKGIDSKKVGDSRMARWLVAIDLIKEKPLIGHGTGVERETLTSAYNQLGMEVSGQNKFNAHNQYLGYAID
ncbi:MAG: O-antigen ligase family protein, partial [Galbibacter orientalis]|uniref:O-antigen ligase family protein n=1 Tax=Galbibacter orientalis TaxID=453852 RepID=UPI003002845A